MESCLSRRGGRLSCLVLCLLLVVWPNPVLAQWEPAKQHIYPFYYPEDDGFRAGGSIPASYNTALRGQNNTEVTYNFARDWLGIPPNGAAILAGTLSLASGVDPNHNDGQTCGVAGWNCRGGRYADLRSFADEHGFGLQDLRTQLFFIGFEFDGSFASADSSLGGGWLAAAKAILDDTSGGANDEIEFAVVFLDDYSGASEIPAGLHTQIDAVYDAYQGNEAIPQDSAIITDLILTIPPGGSCDPFGQDSSNPAFLTERSMTYAPIYGVYNPDGSQRLIPVHPCLAERTMALFRDLNQAMEQLGQPKLWGGGFRSHEEQKRLRLLYCKPHNPDLTDQAIYVTVGIKCQPPVSRPGYSTHEAGLAIDFTVLASGGDIININSDTVLLSSGPGSAAFAWLTQNAGRYGLINFEKENWHWSTNGW